MGGFKIRIIGSDMCCFAQNVKGRTASNRGQFSGGNHVAFMSRAAAATVSEPLETNGSVLQF